jgi:signal transduction histidine kinase
VNPEPTPRTPPAPADTPPPLNHETLRRSLRRANFAWVVIVAVIAALAVGVVWKAGQSAREARRANRFAADAGEQAQRAGTEAGRARDAIIRAEAELWNTRLAEARATRVAGGPAARTKSSQLIADLSRQAGLSETQRLALRTEAIAQLALVDVELPSGWTTQRNRGQPTWDASYRRRVDASGTNQIDIVEVESGKILKTIEGPSGIDRYAATFSPDGRFLACTFNLKSPFVLVWRLADLSLTLSNKIVNLAGNEQPRFSPDSRSVTIFSRAGLELHPVEAGEPPRIFPGIWKAAFSPDSRKLAFPLGTHAEIRSIEDQGVLSRIETPFNTAHLAWHPDGRRVALGGQEGELAIWELPAELTASTPGHLRSLEGHGTTVYGVSFSPDGALLLSRAWDGFACFWEVKSGRRLLAESRAALESFSVDGTWLTADAGLLSARTTARLLNRTGFRTVAQATRTPKLPVALAFSDDGRFVATDHHFVTCLFDALSGRELARLEGRSPVFAPDGTNLFACTDRGVFRFNLRTARLGAGASNWLEGVEILHRDRRRHPQDRFNTLSLAADGRTLVISSSGAGVVLFDLRGEREPRRLTNAPAHFASITPDKAWLVTQLHNGYPYLVNLTNATKPFRLGYHLHTAFSPDGKHLGLTTEEILILMERNASNQWVRTARVPLEIGAGNPASLVFSPDSKSVAVVYDRFDIRLYEVAAARELATFVAPNATAIAGVNSLCFSPEGRFLRAVRRDGELVEWDIPVVRAQLASLGLDWNEKGGPECLPEPSLTNAALLPATLAAIPAYPAQAATSLLPAVAAGVAALMALGAGVFVFLHQRRLLAAYGQADELAGKQQEQLAHAQHALFQSQKMEALGTLATGVAHDFNNLLSIIRMSNQLVARSVKPEGLTRENLDAVEQAVQQGKSIINSMLGYSRRPADTIEDFSVAKVVGDTVGLLSRQFLNGITLNLDFDRSCPQIHGSRTRLEQALLNLIVNASDAMKGNGVLTLSVRSAERPTGTVLVPKASSAYVAVGVIDNGPGIPADVVPRIFEPFFTTKNAGAERGTGLGLSLVYTIARQDGWGLDVQTSPGQGTSFWLLLPASQTELRGRRLPTSPSTDLSGKVTPR